jgi:hypothetical protein
MSARSGLRALLCAASIAVLPAPALANAKQDAQALFAQGNELAGESDFATALEKFRAAYELYPNAKILLNIGTCLRQLGRNAEAAETYEQYMRDPDASAPRVAELERIVREIDSLVGTLHISVTQRGARIRVDGRDVSSAQMPLVLRVDPGEHTVSADKKGFSAVVETVTVGAREQRTLKLSLVRPGTTVVVRPTVDDKGSTQRTIAFAVGGVGIAGVAVGSVFGVLSKVKNDQAAEHCLTDTRCDREGVALGETAQSHATVSTIAFAVGGVALATAITLLVSAPARNKAAAKPAAFVSALPSGVRW